MMTVITRVQLDEPVAGEWDAAMEERMRTAETVEGWMSGEILTPVGAPDRRVIVGNWDSREHWEAWHENPTFQETRDRLDSLGVDDGDTTWHESVYHAHR